jgi:hypothetical protein
MKERTCPGVHPELHAQEILAAARERGRDGTNRNCPAHFTNPTIESTELQLPPGKVAGALSSTPTMVLPVWHSVASGRASTFQYCSPSRRAWLRLTATMLKITGGNGQFAADDLSLVSCCPDFTFST